MRSRFRRLGKIGLLLLLLNELRGAAVVAAVVSEVDLSKPTTPAETSAQVMSGLKCGVLLVGC